MSTFKSILKSFKDKAPYFFDAMFWRAALLVMGTCIGGGLTLLPIMMVPQGCLVGLTTLTAAAFFSVGSSFLLLDLLLETQGVVHFFSLFGFYFSKVVQWIAVSLYFFICYASIVAYIAGMGEELFYAFNFPSILVSCVLITCFGLFFLRRDRDWVLRVNAYIVQLMFVMFLLLVGIMIKSSNLSSIPWLGKYSLASFPICLTAFSHQMILPSLIKRFAKPIVKPAVGFGIFGCWIFYALWILTTFALVPLEGYFGLWHAYGEGYPVTISIGKVLQHSFFPFLSNLFSVFLLFTSFVGVTISLLDLFSEIKEKLQLKKSKPGVHLWMLLLILIPSCVCAVAYPKVFFEALDLSGGIGDALLYGVFPAWVIGFSFKNRKKVPLSKSLTALYIAVIAFLSVSWELTKLKP